MRVNLDSELVNRVKGLKLEFKEDPQPELLISIPNNHPDVDYFVEVRTDEFTSLCPLNLAQPDYATILLKYRPRKLVVELKSLKFYLVSYRMCPVFHEDVPSIILKDLVNLLDPKSMKVVGVFTTRGGLDTTVVSEYTGPVDEPIDELNLPSKVLNPLRKAGISTIRQLARMQPNEIAVIKGIGRSRLKYILDEVTIWLKRH